MLVRLCKNDQLRAETRKNAFWTGGYISEWMNSNGNRCRVKRHLN